MAWRAWVGFGVGLLVWASSAPSSAAERTDLQTLVTAFDRLALREQRTVVKWPADRPLKLKVSRQLGERESTAIAATLAVVQHETKLVIELDPNAGEPHITIDPVTTLGPGATVEMHQTGLTKTTFRRIGGGLIKAAISIVEDWHRGDPYHIYRLVPHETMHALGFNGHVQGFDSVLTVSGGRNSFSEWDLLFLRVLYDPRVPTGTLRVFALPLVCRLMHERLIVERNRDVTDLNPAGSHTLCDDLARSPIEAMTPTEQLRLGWAYLHGLGVPVDLAQSEIWARRAMEHNDPEAPTLLQMIERAKGKR